MAGSSAAIRDRWARTRGPLFTDLYELVMAQIYFHEGLADRPSRFDYFFRSPPDYGTHQAGFCVAAGLGPWCRWVANFEFDGDHVDALATMRDSAGGALFDPHFLTWLAKPGRWRDLEISAVAEGRVVHAHEPVVSVTGPLAIAQLMETSLLNHLNYPTLIATKAARITQSARGGSVLEFGMRRGPATGVNEGIRAALIGGCTGTSDVEASLALGTTPRGTHAHSLVQAYLAIGGGELAAFRAMARVAPDDCVLLVDTVDTLGSGVPNAITVFEELRADGHRPAGIRLDSGDLAHLAVQSAKQLDAAGMSDVPIILSGDLDEVNIWQILTQIDDDAPRAGVDAAGVKRRLGYGVGTRLITSHGDAALNGVYKLVGIHDDQGAWTPAIKLSEDPGKVPLPGRKRVWRLYDRRDIAIADLIGLHDEDPFIADAPDSAGAGTDEPGGDGFVAHHPSRADVHTTYRRADIARVEDLHVPVDVCAPDEPIDELRTRCRDDIEHLDVGVRRLVNPHRYHVSLTERLTTLRREVVARARGQR